MTAKRIYRARVSASQTPPPIMKPPETRDNSRVRRAEKNFRAAKRIYRARVSASQTPPPIMKPPETRDNSRVRRAEKNFRARPASIA